MTDLHILGMARSGTTLARHMVLKLLQANGIDCLSMGEFFSLLRTYEYGDPLPVLLSDEDIPLQEQMHRHDEMMRRYHDRHALYARYAGTPRMVKHIYGYRYDTVLDGLPEQTRFVCVIREDLLDHVLSLLVAASVGTYNASSSAEVAELRARARPFVADLGAVRQWRGQHDEWMASYAKITAGGRVMATLRYEHMDSDLRDNMHRICAMYGVYGPRWPWEGQGPQNGMVADGEHVLKLWSKEDKLALVENHEDVRRILEGSDDGLAI